MTKPRITLEDHRHAGEIFVTMILAHTRLFNFLSPRFARKSEVFKRVEAAGKLLDEVRRLLDEDFFERVSEDDAERSPYFLKGHP